ncbi:MAG TPA: adenosylcobinamide-GDP ribazoletransferase [bacterium]|nr:adenosylcobinamide-GDP ribazoletransferase [bacterium]
MLNALRMAFSTLTLLPVSPKTWKDAEVKASVAFYPLVGAFLGGLLALTTKIHLAHELKAALLMFLWVVVTAAFHLDGLGDCCDGFFGGKTPEDRRRIMKDPAVGSYGITGIVLALFFKYGFLSSVLNEGEAWKWFLLIPLAARWAVTLSCTVFKAPSGDQGLGSGVMGLPTPLFAVATLVSLAVGIALLKLQGLSAFLIAGLVALGVGFLSQNKIKGLTGDGLGATIELSEVACLFFAVYTFHNNFLQL